MAGRHGSAITARREFSTKWTAIRTAFTKMHPRVQIRPIHGTQVFDVTQLDGDACRVEAKPIALSVPERAQHHEPNLYVVVRGWMELVPDGADHHTQWITLGFGTEVGYFRPSADEEVIDHLFGIHYDHDETLPGHPVFHSQIGSQAALVGGLAGVFRVPTNIGADLPGGLLKNVRIPTAQMDVLSVLTQLGADHLCGVGHDEANTNFSALRDACDFVRGRGAGLAFLHTGVAPVCYRSTHWYLRSEGTIERS